MTWRKVSKEEFQTFLREYPNKLEGNVALMCEPPMLNYNDFSGGAKWPHSMVAKAILNSKMSYSKYYDGAPDEYLIKDKE